MRGVIAELSRDVASRHGKQVAVSCPDVARHAAAAMVAVAGRPGNEMGEVPGASTVLLHAAARDVDAILSQRRERLAAHKLPRAIHFAGDLPRTSKGKVLRRALRTDAGPATMQREDPVA